VSALDAHVVRRIGTLDLDAALEVADGEVVAIVGPNGAGKTTLLRVIAGLLPLDDGHLRLDGVTLDDPLTGTFVPPEHRSVGIVFQEGLLFAHLSARDNVSFGLRARGTPKRAANARAEELLAAMRLEPYKHAKPPQLSGGQAQRVALARVLATAPRVLLLDEPLTALDAATRLEVRRMLREHLASYAGLRVLVTHDPLEALTLASRIVVLEGGRVVQVGTPDELRSRPRSAYVAHLLGVNVVTGTQQPDGTLLLESGATLDVADETVHAPRPVVGVIEPNAITLFNARPEGSARNAWETQIVDLDVEPGRTRVRLGAPVPLVADVTPAAVDALGLAPGAKVWAAVKATAVSLHPE
jgi:molybdate transport system ATP-binding protein